MRVAIVVGVLGAIACGPSLPPRFVVERDVGDYAYRRYQEVLDVEFPMEGNTATGHTATYIERRGSDVAFITAFVTVYERATALTAEIRERIEPLSSYDIEVVKREGEYMWNLRGGDAEWLLWVSGNHLVKLGAPVGTEIPEDLIEEYTGLYDSDLDENGIARDGRPSAGNIASEDEEEGSEELELPGSLREGAPR